MQNQTKQKEIYVIFSRTETGMGKMIRKLTKHAYNHVAIALEDSFQMLYSFARYSYNAPLIGGFVKEGYLRYTYMGDAAVKVARICVSEREYTEILARLAVLLEEKEKMIYNSFGALGSLFGRRLHIRDAYTCIEFAAWLLGKEEILRIKELEAMLEAHIVFEGKASGLLREYPLEDDQIFLQRKKKRKIWAGTAAHFGKLTWRSMRRKKNA